MISNWLIISRSNVVRAAGRRLHPVADLRPFSTDRPSKGFTPLTVDAGHFQYETDLLGYLYDSYSQNHVRTREFFTADPVLKLGLTNTLEVDVALGGYQNYQQRGGGVSQDYDGFGDVIVRPKLNVLGNDGGPVAIALAPFFKIPTATHGLGNGAGEFGLTVPITFDLPFETTGGFVPEIDDFKNPANTGRHAAFTGSVSLGRSLTEKRGVTLEYWWQTQGAGFRSSTHSILSRLMRLPPTVARLRHVHWAEQSLARPGGVRRAVAVVLIVVASQRWVAGYSQADLTGTQFIQNGSPLSSASASSCRKPLADVGAGAADPGKSNDRCLTMNHVAIHVSCEARPSLAWTGRP